ncbi:hypothetical protein A3F27_03360 [Candidatus Kaiserbacteria bacterium RIFCSPHIGHO2_12_FULL_53_13]|uniref:Zinc finger DksA/TraR C4-type domain-containing protein n=1 Tax=Candidatus Kaiserbacteria bacterium RIFCSPHIGHO2_12_FULL_53_13 TaxID=1798502 RepID=A0A1F6E5Z6_9BACT|nr:MAG: hypothetical protein A3F27_03360 [Candidatus Kaiserbacteria bacterium RIFCSPHIGHO2_12_FULL_53_13]OGG74324.1 MAG: hypothetical protein A3A37_01910 [Candidatus Kaiserbacteria bacterium RIFCSPLOWO2_01_FULL_52_36]
MNKNDLNAFRAVLDAERETLEEELASHGRATPETGDWQGTTGGLEGEEPDPNDAADQMEELATNVPLVEELEKRHKEITHALQKMENGSYGACEVCGEAISTERLRANPAAQTCIAHAR